jgi:hypothetical protein
VFDRRFRRERQIGANVSIFQRARTSTRAQREDFASIRHGANVNHTELSATLTPRKVQCHVPGAH